MNQVIAFPKPPAKPVPLHRDSPAENAIRALRSAVDMLTIARHGDDEVFELAAWSDLDRAYNACWALRVRS
jgi:hypothetical protein